VRILIKKATISALKLAIEWHGKIATHSHFKTAAYSYPIVASNSYRSAPLKYFVGHAISKA